MLNVLRSYDDVKLRKYFITVFSSISAIVFIVFGTWYVLYKNVMQGSFELFIGLVFIINLYFLWVRNTVEISAKIVVFFVMLISLMVFYSGGIGNTGNLWIMLVPMFPLLLLSLKDGTKWLYIYSVVLLGLILAGMFDAVALKFSFIELRQTLIVYLLFCIMLYYNEMVKYIAKVSLEKSNQENREKDRLLFTQAKSEQMGELLSMIAHQWRQPLSAISATIGMLEVKHALGEYDERSYSEQLNKISSYSQDLSETIENFRNFYKPNADSILLTFEEIAEKSLSVIKTSLENEGIEVIHEHASQNKIALHDNEMMQVILNLLQNSRDAFKENNIQNPSIKIITEESSLCICDNGGGISEDIIDKIFDPYFSTKKEKNGTGLGLYMARVIVEEHHTGTLSVYNQDDGICFSIKVEEEK